MPEAKNAYKKQLSKNPNHKSTYHYTYNLEIIKLLFETYLVKASMKDSTTGIHLLAPVHTDPFH